MAADSRDDRPWYSLNLIFNTFFPIKDIEAIIHRTSHIRPSYYGILEDNDPNRRLFVVVNHDNDVPEYPPFQFVLRSSFGHSMETHWDCVVIEPREFSSQRTLSRIVVMRGLTRRFIVTRCTSA